jgi:hypothetical protein
VLPTQLKSESRTRSDAILVQVIEETLGTCFGKTPTAIIFDVLKNRFMLPKNEIPAKPETFSRGLHALFGLASSQIERNILRKLSEKSGKEYVPKEGLNFVDNLAAYRAAVEI